jgi:carboxyl-terminal processing protease
VNRSRLRFLVVSLALMMPLLAAIVWSSSTAKSADPGEDGLYKYLTVFSEVLGLVRQTYVEPRDVSALLAGAMDGATDALDPWSVFVPRSAVATWSGIESVGSTLSGIVAVRDRGVVYAVEIEEGSPAATAGLETGDVLAKIDDRSTRDLPMWEIVRALSRPAGTKLALELLRRGETKQATVELGAFTPPAPRVDTVGDGLPMLRIARLEERSAAAVQPLLEKLASEKKTRLLVDLRGLSGGSGAGAAAVADLFADGPLGSLVDRGKTVESWDGKPGVAWKGDLVVLVDSSTAGAAEVLAATLRASAGAKVVGLPTLGHTGRLETVELPSGGRLRLTTAFYAGPDGQSLETGIGPDLVVDELTRTFGDRETPIRELILEHGIRVLTGDEPLPAAKAA